MRFNAIKRVRTGNGFKERLHVKSYKTRDEMFGFLNAQDDTWREAMHDDTKVLKTGVYAFAGGAWHNVKTLDPSVLAHV